jgi:hypothetical protein
MAIVFQEIERRVLACKIYVNVNQTALKCGRMTGSCQCCMAGPIREVGKEEIDNTCLLMIRTAVTLWQMYLHVTGNKMLRVREMADIMSLAWWVLLTESAD